MKYGKDVQQYWAKLRDYDPHVDNEHTYRTDLENLLRVVCADIAKDVDPRHEIKAQQRDLGGPDFSFVNKKSLGTIGLLENKPIGFNLDSLINSAQVRKYRKRSENIILTNYLDWLRLKDGEVTHRVSLGTIEAVKRKTPPDGQAVNDLHNLFTAFLSLPPRGIGRKKELAEQLAIRCHDLREFLVQEMDRQEKTKEQSALHDMHRAFQQYVDSHLTSTDFANAFAQTLGYSLFLAKLNVQPEGAIIDLDNVQKFIPKHFSLIKTLANFLKELKEDNYLPIRHRVEEILGMMNHLHLHDITHDLSFNRQLPLDDDEGRLFERDPYVYFYEDFLKVYDPEERMIRGNYYTPPPVVNFIVRGINQILKKNFSIADGLADSKQVQLLDFATGTGTFLLEAMQQMFEEPGIANSKTLQKSLVKDHVLENFYGFEYLIAPYTVAHLKLSQFLKDKGCEITEPLKIFLTNTLEIKAPQENIPFMQKLREESASAYEVKKTDILVITGNPPYNVKSSNPWPVDIENPDNKKIFGKKLQINPYKPEGETKLNWDDYVKFIRFAHHKMEVVARGVIGIITNNSFLNAITLRQMRNRLMKDFNAIYILNLHGNSLIGELAPDGKQDASVFDIRVGTCITFLVKTEKKPQHCQVYYAAIKSSRQLDKYRQLVASGMGMFKPLDVAAFNQEFAKTRWSKRFTEPLSFFVPNDDDFAERLETYGDFWGVTDIFETYGSGVKTDRDDLVINYDAKELAANMRKAFTGHYDENFKTKYAIKNSSSYDFVDRLERQKYDEAAIRTVLYHPFDPRFIYYKVGFTSRPAWEVMQHIFSHDNVGLIVKRQLPDSAKATYVMVADTGIVDGLLGIDNKGRDSCFPLYLYPSADQHGDIINGNGKHENFRPVFRQWVDKKYGRTYKPEQILGYIYAVLHSPVFRQRYQELLKIDFPRIPFVDGKKQFEQLSALGWELIEAHLLKKIPGGVSVGFPVIGSDKVEKIIYQEATRRLHINDKQYFDHVPSEAWNFVIGGYHVLDKYLKERKKAGRALGLAEFQHIPKIVRILRFTHAQMQKIDQAFDCP